MTGAHDAEHQPANLVTGRDDPDQAYATAASLFGRGRTAEAERIIAHSLGTNPQHGNCRNLLGAIRFREGRFSEAAGHFASAAAAMPHDPGIALNAATAFEQAGNYVEAATWYMQLMALDPGQVRSRDLAYRFAGLGQAHAAQQLVSQATAAYVAALILDPDNVYQGYMTIRVPQIAVRVYRELTYRFPERAEFVELLAFSQAEFGQARDATASFSVLTELLSAGDPDGAPFHDSYNRGMLATRTRPRLKKRRRTQKMAAALARTAGLIGRVAECGCAKGMSSFVIASAMQRSDRTFDGTGFHIFDSFEGLSEPTEHDREGATGAARANMGRGRFACSLDRVKAGLAEFPGISFHPGWIPTRFNDVQDCQFRFLNLDVDLYQPSRDSIRFFYPRLVSGGMIVCDDYNWPGCQKAIAECADEFGFTVDVSPDGQAVIVKP